MSSEYSVIHSVMQQATLIDYPGRMSALMFTSGCNFRCGFCHNYESLHEFDAKTYTFEKLAEICKGIKKQWTHAVTITGGEPTLHAGLPMTMQFLREQGFAIKLDSNGSNPEMLQEVLPLVDYIAMDLKCPLDRYKALVGYGDTDKIRQSIRIIMNSGKPYEFRTTMVEPYFSREDLNDMGKTVMGAERYTVQAFVPHDNLPDISLRMQPRTRPSFLNDAAEILRGYVKNVVVHGA